MTSPDWMTETGACRAHRRTRFTTEDSTRYKSNDLLCDIDSKDIQQEKERIIQQGRRFRNRSSLDGSSLATECQRLGLDFHWSEPHAGWISWTLSDLIDRNRFVVFWLFVVFSRIASPNWRRSNVDGAGRSVEPNSNQKGRKKTKQRGRRNPIKSHQKSMKINGQPGAAGSTLSTALTHTYNWLPVSIRKRGRRRKRNREREREKRSNHLANKRQTKG